MEANRLAEIKRMCEFRSKYVPTPEEVREMLTHIDQQQVEIECLNRAYEVLEQAVLATIYGKLSASLTEAQRIKEGDGEQG